MTGTSGPARRARGPRWPRRVYGVGEEPDPRFSLANERTFLAWVRTSLALLAAGVALEALDLPVESHLRRAASIVLLVLACLAAVQCWRGWVRTERSLRTGAGLPPPLLGVPMGAGIVVVAVLLIVGSLV